VLVVGALLVTLVVVVVAAAMSAARTTRRADAVPAVTLSATPGDLGRTTSATQTSLRQFWSERLPATYQRPFRDLRGGFQPKTSSSPPFRCGGEKQTYRDIQGNAFYCPDGDYIAWDAALLFPRLDRTFGNVSPAIVLAHEMGHAIQSRAGVAAPSIVIELQADCFAGSWVHWAQTSPSDPVAVAEPALDTALAAILVLRDQPGTTAVNPQAHGLGFDRVNAFQTGYDQGTGACATFPAGNVVTTELPFQTYDEALTGGNAPYDQAVPLFTASLDRFWAGALPVVAPGHQFRPPAPLPVPTLPLPPCGTPGAYDVRAPIGYCPSDNTVIWADDRLRLAHQLGDFVTGTLFSEAWGRAAQTQGGLPVDGPPAALQRDCFTGAWVASIAAGSPDALFSLSPGDIDEVLETILAGSIAPRTTTAQGGGAFERTDALRRGLLQGLAACH
jgi:predicted metalloprotease